MQTPNNVANEVLLAYRFRVALENEDYLTCAEIKGIITRRTERGTINTYTATEPFRNLETGLIDYSEYNNLFDALEQLHPELYCYSAAPEWAILAMAGVPMCKERRDFRQSMNIMNNEDDMDFPSQMLGDLS